MRPDAPARLTECGLLAAMLCVVVVWWGCAIDSDGVGPRAGTVEGGSVSVKIAIPAVLAQTVARVEHVIVTSEADTLRGRLEIVGNMARGTVTGIPPGEDLLFVLIAFDAAGETTHAGSARADVEAGVTAEVRIQLQPVTGGAVIVGDFGGEPLFPKALQLAGRWDLELVADQEFEFSYSFDSDGDFSNRISGAFLSALKDLDQLEDLDLGQLDEFDGGTLILSGTWSPGADSLHLDFDAVAIELFGDLPFIGKVDVEILEEDLGDGAAFDLAFGCAVKDDELRLRGPALTLGVPLAVEDAAGPAAAEYPGLSGIGVAGLGRLGAVIGALIRERNVDEVVLVRSR